MESKKTYKSLVYNYGRHEIQCNETSLHPLYEDLFENATITFNDSGTITIEGELVQWGIEFHDVYPSELEYEVDPEYIEKTRFRKRDIVRRGWHKKLKRDYRKLTLSNFVIIES